MSPRALYRTYLGHLRQIPDPHVWATLVPHYRELLERSNARIPGHAAERAAEEMRLLEAAVACHSHALKRLIEKCYGQRGRVKWELVKNVTLSTPIPPSRWPAFALEASLEPEVRFPPTTYQPVPPPIRPLIKTPPDPPAPARARSVVPMPMQRRTAKNKWEFMWTRVRTPIALPSNEDGSRTGWEGKGVVEAFRQLAGVEGEDSVERVALEGRQLPTYGNLPRSLQACFPKRPVKHVMLDVPRPPASSTRRNPSTWAEATPLTPRVLRRTYRRVWDSLPWVLQMKNGHWVSCQYSDMTKQPAPRHVRATATEGEMKWLEGL